jgi:glutaredoxin 3
MAEITMYSRSWCPYCRAAKELLDAKGADYQEVDIEREPRARQEMIQKAGGRTSVPQIFIGERHVGGCDDLYALDGRGELDKLLHA